MLLHGSDSGRGSWVHQLPLAARWRLERPSRHGYDDAPLDGDPGFERDAATVAAQLLDEPAHLVGFSYGGIVALLAAAHRPAAVRSLVVLEPPAFMVARDDAAVQRLVAELRRLLAEPLPVEEFGRRFAALAVGVPPDAGPLHDGRRQQLELIRREQSPWDADLPLAAVRHAGIPTLVITGGWNDAYEAVGDRLAAALGAERRQLPGHGHGLRRHGATLNELLERHWRAADAGEPPAPTG